MTPPNRHQHSLKERTLALAGVMQSAELVHQISTNGQCSQHAAQASLGSVFAMSPGDTESIFGGVTGVRLGLSLLAETFGPSSQSANIRTLHYALALLKLGSRVMRQPKRQRALGEAIALIETAWTQSDEPLDPSVTAQLADAYQRHISTLSFRIRVQGNPAILKNDDKIALIRALLLAGIRSVFLWRQLGGNQWRLLIDRKAMVNEAERLI